MKVKPAKRASSGEGQKHAKKPRVQEAETISSGSELSVVLDEQPGKKKSSAKQETTKKVTQSVKAASDPTAEEIKLLQGWLIKCGIRKMWHRELSGCATADAKIRHLKGLLAEAGMPGRYSKEKAEQIRNERELQADLEAVQEGERAWGKPDDDGAEKSPASRKGVPKRRIAKGLQELAFLNDDDDSD